MYIGTYVRTMATATAMGRGVPRIPYMLLPPVAQLLTNVHYCSPVPSHIH